MSTTSSQNRQPSNSGRQVCQHFSMSFFEFLVSPLLPTTCITLTLNRKHTLHTILCPTVKAFFSNRHLRIRELCEGVPLKTNYKKFLAQVVRC